MARTEIASVKPVRTNTLEGWGIHYSRFGWLDNVSGFSAVAITLRNGKRFALGSDEPEKWAENLVQQTTHRISKSSTARASSTRYSSPLG